MQSHDWNDLKYLLALHRSGKLREAGLATGVSETTIARRLRRIEDALGVILFVRSAAGLYEPTDAGIELIAHAETVEREHIAIQEKLGGISGTVSGVVRISSVPIIVNRVLVHALASLTDRHPQLAVELVPSAGNLDLSRREADLAVRFARPAQGGLRIRAQKLAELAFGVYGPPPAEAEHPETLPWIGYDEAHSGLPQARWIEAELNRQGAPRASLRVTDAETALEAAAAGLGRTILPRLVADRDKRLSRLPAGDGTSLPVRDVWLLSHVDQSARVSVAVVKDWLAGIAWGSDG
ncbi:LysR family transcriptional regulator [uncultured Roseibium sp.]|uniref:LysR family transcriptional regulator n=1 Tax=uncultured Roseibium sp. TaxID=1936171 RepID=UPI002614942C|nr:LysR family transcriptional regulator [uncultured Roseibium sp.]